MITRNGIELTDTEYKERLISVLNKLTEEFEKLEDYETCQACKGMLSEIDSQTTEEIKDKLTKFETLLKLRNL
jgi:uncharacterized protein with PIN domain